MNLYSKNSQVNQNMSISPHTSTSAVYYSKLHCSAVQCVKLCGIYVQLHNFVIHFLEYNNKTDISIKTIQIYIAEYCQLGEIHKIKVIIVIFFDRSCVEKRAAS
jgi:hypothetical protein